MCSLLAVRPAVDNLWDRWTYLKLRASFFLKCPIDSSATKSHLIIWQAKSWRTSCERVSAIAQAAVYFQVSSFGARLPSALPVDLHTSALARHCWEAPKQTRVLGAAGKGSASHSPVCWHHPLSLSHKTRGKTSLHKVSGQTLLSSPALLLLNQGTKRHELHCSIASHFMYHFS